MQTAVTKTANQGQLALTNRSWPVGFSRLLETAAQPKTFLSPSTTRRALLSLGDEGAVKAWLGAAIDGPKPAEMRDFVMHLGRLSLHYWRPDFTPEQAKLMFQDFARDMATVTASELEQACQDYRANPKNSFFPTPGKLIDLVQDGLRQRARDRYAAERLVAILNNTPAPEPRGGPLPTVAEVLARHGRTMPETAADAKLEPINISREETPESLAALARGLQERMARA